MNDTNMNKGAASLSDEQRTTIQHAADKLRTVWANHTGDKESRELCHKLEALLATPTPQADAAIAAGGAQEAVAWLVEWQGKDQFSDETWVHAHANEPTARDQARAHGGTCTPLYAAPLPRVAATAWQPIETAPREQVVMVYTPPRDGDWPDTVRIDFDSLSPEGDGDYWINHSEHYEHYMAVGGSGAAGPDVVCTGPSEKAPYTHWMPLPAAPAASNGEQA